MQRTRNIIPLTFFKEFCPFVIFSLASCPVYNFKLSQVGTNIRAWSVGVQRLKRKHNSSKYLMRERRELGEGWKGDGETSNFVSNMCLFQNQTSNYSICVTPDKTDKAVGDRGPFILGTALETRSPSFSCHCHIIPWFVKVPIYCWVHKESFQSPSDPSLHNNRIALTTQPWRLPSDSNV